MENKNEQFWKSLTIIFLILFIIYAAASFQLSNQNEKLIEQNKELREILNEVGPAMCIEKQENLMCEAPIQSKPMCYDPEQWKK